MINLPNGLNITVREPVDSRIVLTKAEMLAQKKGSMPDNYICVCKDDGKLYIWSSEYEVDPEFGRFKPYEEVIDIPSAIQNAINTQPDVLDSVISQALPGALADALAAQSKGSGLKVDEDGNISIDYDDEQFQINLDNKLELAISLIQAVDSN